MNLSYMVELLLLGENDNRKANNYNKPSPRTPAARYSDKIILTDKYPEWLIEDIKYVATLKKQPLPRFVFNFEGVEQSAVAEANYRQTHATFFKSQARLFPAIKRMKGRKILPLNEAAILTRNIEIPVNAPLATLLNRNPPKNGDLGMFVDAFPQIFLEIESNSIVTASKKALKIERELKKRSENNEETMNNGEMDDLILSLFEKIDINANVEKHLTMLNRSAKNKREDDLDKIGEHVYISPTNEFMEAIVKDGREKQYISLEPIGITLSEYLLYKFYYNFINKYSLSEERINELLEDSEQLKSYVRKINVADFSLFFVDPVHPTDVDIQDNENVRTNQTDIQKTINSQAGLPTNQPLNNGK